MAKAEKWAIEVNASHALRPSAGAAACSAEANSASRAPSSEPMLASLRGRNCSSAARRAVSWSLPPSRLNAKSAAWLGAASQKASAQTLAAISPVTSPRRSAPPSSVPRFEEAAMCGRSCCATT